MLMLPYEEGGGVGHWLAYVSKFTKCYFEIAFQASNFRAYFVTLFKTIVG